MSTKTGLIIHLVAKIAWAALFVSGLLLVVFGQAEKGATVFVLGCSMWVATRAISEGLNSTAVLHGLWKNKDSDSDE